MLKGTSTHDQFPRARVITALMIGLFALVSLTCEQSTSVRGDSTFPIIRPPVEEGMNDSLAGTYRQDAYRLAVRYMLQEGDMSVEIPAELSDALFNSLRHIYYATEIPARDLVVDTYRIHSFPNPPLHEVVLYGVDTSCTWVRRLKAGEHPIGNPRVDSLIAAYQLVLERTFGSSLSQFIVLESPLALNIEGLAKRFTGVECIGGAEPNGSCCDGNDITAVAGANAWLITFRLGWGDCPAGCISSHYWDFRVTADGTVEYLGSRGSPIPSERPQP